LNIFKDEEKGAEECKDFAMDVDTNDS